jgi:hypothetical protein
MDLARLNLTRQPCTFHTHSIDPSINEIGSLVSRYRYPVKPMMAEEINSFRCDRKRIAGRSPVCTDDPSDGEGIQREEPFKMAKPFQLSGVLQPRRWKAHREYLPVEFFIRTVGLFSITTQGLDHRVRKCLDWKWIVK